MPVPHLGYRLFNSKVQARQRNIYSLSGPIALAGPLKVAMLYWYVDVCCCVYINRVYGLSVLVRLTQVLLGQIASAGLSDVTPGQTYRASTV